MDAQNYTGGFAVLAQPVCHAYLRRGSRAVEFVVWLANSRPAAFATLVETITKEDRAATDSILRSWGVRR